MNTRRIGGAGLLARLFMVLLALVVVSAACSDDDNDKTASSKSTAKTKRSAATASTTTAERTHGPDRVASATTTTTLARVPDSFTGGDKTKYCAAWTDLKNYFFFPSSSPDEVKRIYAKYGEISSRMVATGPKEIADELTRAQEINDEVVRTGSTYPLDMRETERLVAVIQPYSDKQCA